jgi:hypothetical protein
MNKVKIEVISNVLKEAIITSDKMWEEKNHMHR